MATRRAPYNLWSLPEDVSWQRTEDELYKFPDYYGKPASGGYDGSGINPQGVPKLDPNTGRYTIPPPLSGPFGSALPKPTGPSSPTDWGGGIPDQQKRQTQDAINKGAPAGFDQGKWKDTNWQSTKYQAGRIIAAGGSVDDILRQPSFKGYTRVSDDKIKAPDGNIYDVIYDSEGAHRAQFTLVGGPRWEQENPGNGRGGQAANTASPQSSSMGDWDTFLGSLGRSEGGTGGGGVNSQLGMQGNVGQDWLSQLITGGLGRLAYGGGANQFGNDVNATLADVIRGSAGGPNQERMNARLETLREQSGLAQRSMANDAREALASRNLLSEPGTPQGPEISAMTRISERIAPQFAQGLRDAYVSESQLADQRLMQGLGLAADQSQAQSANLLGTLSAGTERQGVLAQIALGTLDRNIVWNQFLANYGLDRERLVNEIQNGRFQNVQQIMELFAKYVEMARNGQIE